MLRKDSEAYGVRVIDENKHVVEFTFIKPDGKPIELRGEFERTGARADLLERHVR